MPTTMPSAPDFAQMLESQYAGGGPALVMLIVWALLVCFLGYPLLRIQLVMAGLVGGVLLGLIAASALYGQPSGADYLIFCLAGAILLGLLSWFLYRVVLGLAVLAGVTGLAAMLMNYTHAGWVVGGLAGLVLAVLVFIYTRPLVIVLTSVNGSMAAALAATMLVTGASAPEDLLAAFRRNVATVVIAAGAALVLAALGLYCQFRLARKYRMWMSPEQKGQADAK
ncbi:MAG: DUF4203 domain-containing protein [Planctomycetaceae bacterium]|nr:DUF4203 domain-containing protein [Planctomycetaceae bacterium]